MRGRIWAYLALAIVLLAVTACAARQAPEPATTPGPVKTLRPTFTATVPKPTVAPTATPQVVVATAEPEPTTAPAATPEPVTPTTEPSPTAKAGAASFTVTSAVLNVRAGPGITFAVIGRLTTGQSFPITGKNNDARWWEFDHNGRKGWVAASNISVKGGDTVQVAKNIPAAPTAAPRPTARPQTQPQPQPAQPQPAQPQPAGTKYGQTKGPLRMPDTNDWVTVYCMLWDRPVKNLLAGTIRITRDGQVVEAGKAFTQFGTWYLSYPYNDGCKVEIRPAVNGNYSAVLLEGGQPASDVISFTVSGSGDRITFVEWKEK